MSLSREVIKGSFWTLSGQLGYMMISLVTNIILARILSPPEFGQVGIAMFFITLSSIISESGFGGALVRLVEIKKADYSTAFVFNLGLGVICYFVLFFLSGTISMYYQDPALSLIIKISALVLVINAFTVNQNVMLARELNFKKKYSIQLIAVSISSITAIFLANAGAGIWAMIIFQMLTVLLNMFILMFMGYSNTSFKFDNNAFRRMYSFGINTTLASLINTTFDNIYQLILGRYFSINTAGLYYQAKKLQAVPFTIFSSVIQGVAYSSLAKLQGNKDEFANLYNKIGLMFTILMGAITSFIYLYSESLIAILYGGKWLGATLFIELLSIASFFYFQELLVNMIFKVFNQTRRILYLELFKKLIQTISIILGVYTKDINILLFGFVVSSIISYLINYLYSKNILYESNVRSGIGSILKVVLVSIFTVTICKYCINKFGLNYINGLFLIPLFLFAYYFLLRIFKVSNLFKDILTLKIVLRGEKI